MAKDDTFQKSKEIALYNREKISEFLRKEQSLKDKIEKHEKIEEPINYNISNSSSSSSSSSDSFSLTLNQASEFLLL